MSHQPVPTTPRTNAPRPQLPYIHVNPFLSMTDASKPPVVKYQVITREGQEITVGRVKIQTPGNGHAFVLRRFDTGAISLTTMYRAAFPSAGEEAEKVEASWVKANYDSTGANGGPGRDTLRLAGTWVHPEVAQAIASSYSLEHIVEPLVNTVPDPAQQYRRSTKQASPQKPAVPSVAASPAKAGLASARSAEASPVQPRTPTSPSPAGPAPAKRRKESTPVAASPPTSRTADSLPTPRRSGRVSASPVPAAVPNQTPSRAARPKAVGRTPRTPVKTEKLSNRLTPIDSDNAGAEEDDEAPEVPGPDMEEDVAEQKALIAKLKAEREANEQTTTAAKAEEPSASSEVPAVAMQEESSASSESSKRSREEEKEKLQFNFREPDVQPVAAREVKTNKRIRKLEPQEKSAAWGVFWFAASFAAAATIPTLFM